MILRVLKKGFVGIFMNFSRILECFKIFSLFLKKCIRGFLKRM